MKITILEYKSGLNLFDIDLSVLPIKNEFIEHKHIMYEVMKTIHSEKEIQVYVTKKNEKYSDSLEAEIN